MGVSNSDKPQHTIQLFSNTKTGFTTNSYYTIRQKCLVSLIDDLERKEKKLCLQHNVLRWLSFAQQTKIHTLIQKRAQRATVIKSALQHKNQTETRQT